MTLVAMTIRNFGPFRHATLGPLRPLTALVGPNGAGKSTVFRVFDTMRTALSRGVGAAFEACGFDACRHLGSDEPISFGFVFDDGCTYEVAFVADREGPVVLEEKLERGGTRLVEYSRGAGVALSNELAWNNPDAQAEYEHFASARPDELGIGALGRIASYPSAAKLLKFFDGWRAFRPDVRAIRSGSPGHRATALDERAGNLADVLRGLGDVGGAQWRDVLDFLRPYVPELRDVIPEAEVAGNVSLRFRDTAFERWYPAALASEGTLLLLAHATLLSGGSAPSVLGLEEAETAIHHAALQELAERYRAFALSHGSRVLVATQVPELLNALEPAEVFVVSKKPGGSTIHCVADDPNVASQFGAGDQLGALFRQNLLPGANP